MHSRRKPVDLSQHIVAPNGFIKGLVNITHKDEKGGSSQHSSHSPLLHPPDTSHDPLCMGGDGGEVTASLIKLP